MVQNVSLCNLLLVFLYYLFLFLFVYLEPGAVFSENDVKKYLDDRLSQMERSISQDMKFDHFIYFISTVTWIKLLT